MYKNITLENLLKEHICCAISDKKHQKGIQLKKEWLSEQIQEGHVFRKLDERGKVFIEYADIEKAWVSVLGSNYIYIYCLWVSGKFKNNDHAKKLLEYAIEDAKKKGKSGICVMSSKKKKPFLSDKKFFIHFGFEVIDQNNDYELLGLKFDNGEVPQINKIAKTGIIKQKELTIFYSPQCPYIINCIEEIRQYCDENKIEVNLIKVDSIDKAKNIPAIFNNFAVFINGKFETVHLLNKNKLKKLLDK